MIEISKIFFFILSGMTALGLLGVVMLYLALSGQIAFV